MASNKITWWKWGKLLRTVEGQSQCPHLVSLGNLSPNLHKERNLLTHTFC
uniref:Uncharacterized protein n=1 Tax=Anguilla anguilla TaxID=7936 RepID=A0A0E9VZ82_ANGAN